MGTVTLVTGGARSGKSSLALRIAKEYREHRALIATAEAFDQEMRERIANHRKERGGAFATVEAPYELADAVRSLGSDISIAVVDCLTVWLGNLFHLYGDDDLAIRSAVEELCESLTELPFDIILVTNEVGMGIVPETPLGRRFRDMAGMTNQRIAAIADSVLLCCCGIPMQIKGKKGNS